MRRLDITSGTIFLIMTSTVGFREAANDADKRKDWFLEELAKQAGGRGCSPGKGQCVGGRIPFVFAQSANAPDNMYVADLYEYVACMGDLHGQMKNIPDDGQVRLKIQPRPVQLHPREN